MTTPDDPRFLSGIELFNTGEFFEAHEAWEDLWSEAAGDDRRFFQGLIQAAVGLCHFANGNHRGAVKLFHSSKDYMRDLPPRFLGIDLDDFRRQMHHCFEKLLTQETAQSIELEEERIPVIRRENSEMEG